MADSAVYHIPDLIASPLHKAAPLPCLDLPWPSLNALHRPPAQPPLPEPISFKIAQRSTRQLNLDPESPDTKPLLTPLPELHPAIPPQLATAAQPAVCQPAADVSGAVSHPDIQQPPPAAPAAMLASTLPQLPATASQAELHRLGHAHMMVAPTQAYTGRSATAALGPGLELDPTSSVPTTNMLPNPDAQSIAAVGEGRHDQHAVAQAQAELRSISPTLPDKMAAEQRTHTGEAAVHTAAASHSVPSPTRKRPARAAADIEKSDDAGNRQRPAQDPEASDDLSDRLIHHNRAMPDSRRNSQDRPYMPEEPRLAHRPYTGSRPDSLSKAPIHSKATPHDKHQPHSYQPERSRAPRRFSDTPSVLRSPDRKRSREPERAPVQDLSKRLRTDPWQPVMPSQAPHHRHLDIRNAKREANHLAAVRRQEERDSSQSLSPSSDRHGQLLNGHAPRHVPNSRFAVHQEHSMSISPSAPHPQASPVPESSSARSGQRQRASESGYPPSGVYANGYLQDASRESMRDPIRSCKKDTSRGPPAHFQDPSLRRNSSWSTVDPHSGADSCVARNYSNYGRHPQLSALEAHRSPSSHSVHEQDPLDRRHSSLHSSDAATPHADRHRNSVSESMLQTAHEGQLDRAGSDRASRHRSLGSFDRSQDQNATHWQHTHDTSPKADQRRHGYTSAALRHAPYRQTEERSRLQMQQHSEAAKQAAAVKLGADMDRWLDKLCQSYGMPASAVGNGPMLKNQERSGLLDLMSAAVSAIEEIDPVLFTITYAVSPMGTQHCSLSQVTKHSAPNEVLTVRCCVSAVQSVRCHTLCGIQHAYTVWCCVTCAA